MKKYLPYFLFTIAFVIIAQNISYAASSEDLAAMGVGTELGTFNSTLTTIATGIVKAGKAIAVIMTAIAGTMVVLNIQDGTKTVWNIILGVGLALNLGGFLLGVWGDYMTTSSVATHVTNYNFDLKDSGAVDILSGFMNNYTQNVIIPGAKAIVPISAKLLIILTLIDASLKLSLDLISGDKVKFLIKVTLQSGFYLFLITNWLSGLDLMQALSNAFEGIGFLAGGTDVNTVLKPDSIVNNAIVMFNAVWSHAKFSLSNIGLTIINLVSVIVIVVCLFLTAIEMFMARIEFYTMALITIPLLAFGVCDKTRFLSEKAIGAMFNLAIKVCVIAFISTMACPMLKDFADKFEAASQTAGFFTKINYILQAVLICGILLIITYKIPKLVSGLLAGQPSLGGADMTRMAMNAASTAGGAPGKIAGAVRAASNADGGGNAMAEAAINTGNKIPSRMSQMGGTAVNLAKMAYRQNPVSQSFQGTAGNLTRQFENQEKNMNKATVATVAKQQIEELTKKQK